ncbi:hypothetical protein VNI00_015669 [Paramarasmius palmivorus]|uniref:C2H2-type domain-containing protein n=1 Tax=Paramarasmius palmivorus TaxID=297713 RepID=A0AAW0BJ00_9AGAR
MPVIPAAPLTQQGLAESADRQSSIKELDDLYEELFGSSDPDPDQWDFSAHPRGSSTPPILDTLDRRYSTPPHAASSPDTAADLARKVDQPSIPTTPPSPPIDEQRKDVKAANQPQQGSPCEARESRSRRRSQAALEVDEDATSAVVTTQNEPQMSKENQPILTTEVPQSVAANPNRNQVLGKRRSPQEQKDSKPKMTEKLLKLALPVVIRFLLELKTKIPQIFERDEWELLLGTAVRTLYVSNVEYFVREGIVLKEGSTVDMSNLWDGTLAFCQETIDHFIMDILGGDVDTTGNVQRVTSVEPTPTQDSGLLQLPFADERLDPDIFQRMSHVDPSLAIQRPIRPLPHWSPQRASPMQIDGSHHPQHASSMDPLVCMPTLPSPNNHPYHLALTPQVNEPRNVQQNLHQQQPYYQMPYHEPQWHRHSQHFPATQSPANSQGVDHIIHTSHPSAPASGTNANPRPRGFKWVHKTFPKMAVPATATNHASPPAPPQAGPSLPRPQSATSSASPLPSATKVNTDSRPCGCLCSDNSLCGQLVAPDGVVAHFLSVHGIEPDKTGPHAGKYKCPWHSCCINANGEHTENYYRDDTFWRHLKSVHFKFERLRCGRCGESYSRRSSWKRHVDVCGSKKPKGQDVATT